MPDVLLTDDFKQRHKAYAVQHARWKTGVGFVFDPERSHDATRTALQLFPDLRARLEPELVASIDEADTARPPDFASEFRAGRPAHELLANVEADLLEKLYPYQVTDLAYTAARMRESGGGYVGWDRGLGKTLGTIVLMEELKVHRAVVVCPNASKEAVWRPEFEKWTARFTDRIFNLGGDQKRRTKVLHEWGGEGGILLVHYEALRLVEQWPLLDMVVVDEAHRLARGGPGGKSPQFYKALKKMKCLYRLALSGSVIINTPEDIFGAAHWLYPKQYRSRYKDWNNRWFNYAETPFGPKLVGVKPGRLEELKEELATFMVVRYKQDELEGLPDKITQDVYVDLSPAQRKVYDDLAEHLIAELPDGEMLTAPTVLAQLGKLRQVATGLDLLGQDFQDSSKIDLALQMVQDNLPHKTVVFAWHRATCRAIAARLEQAGVHCATVTGDTPQNQRAELVREFQESDECKVIVATIKTLGESVTLHAAADVLFVESSWTPADMEQAADRVYRIGQNRRVTVTNIIARGTVDELRVLPTVRGKEAIRRIVLGSAS